MLRKVEAEIAGRQGKQRGSFHHFVSDQEGNSWAVVELQDGTVHYTSSQTMRFMHPENRVQLLALSYKGMTAEFLGFAQEIDYNIEHPASCTVVMCKLDDGSIATFETNQIKFLDA